MEQWALPNRSTPLESQSETKNKSLMAHHFSWYTWELSFGQTLQNKSEELLGTSWGNNLGTWEPFGNLMKLIGDKEKNKKNPLATQKKLDLSWVHAEPSHWLHGTFISKTICHHFQSGLRTVAQILGHS